LILDIKKDNHGQYYDLAINKDANDPFNFQVVDIDRYKRHLLLMSRQDKLSKSKFLCGHDEREWFVAGVSPSTKSIFDAMEDLKPKEVLSFQDVVGIETSEKGKRKTKAYLRQGEWFFVPQDLSFKPNPLLVIKDEPLRRTGGKPHMAELCYRTGGTTVYVCGQFPNGLTQSEYNAEIKKNSNASSYAWSIMTADAGVYVMGAIRHSDHKTINLGWWHRVYMNKETGRGASVRFLD
jgi:hypothetical protein